MNTIQMYFRYLGVTFRTQLEYKGSFIMLTVANAVNAALEFLAVLAFFSRFGGLDGWTFHEVAVFFGLANLTYAITESWMRGFDRFNYMIKDAGFDRILLRPRSTVLQIMGSDFQLLRVGRFVVGASALAWGIRGAGVSFHGTEWTLLVATVLGGAMLFGGVILAQATNCFWTIESIEVFNILTYGGIETCQYPLSIYDKMLMRFFMFVVPLAAINYWPCSVLLHRGYVHPLLAWLSPVIGPAFYGLGLLLWRFGVRHYRSTGS